MEEMLRRVGKNDSAAERGALRRWWFRSVGCAAALALTAILALASVVARFTTTLALAAVFAFTGVFVFVGGQERCR